VSKLLLIAALSTFAAFAATGCANQTDEEQDEPMGESQDHLLAGARLSPSEVAGHLRAVGFPESAIGKMVCTAKYESSFYSRASNRNRNGTTDRGLFQINSTHLGEAGCPGSSTGLWDPHANAKCALNIYRSQGVNAWYGYQKHRTECSAARAPASAPQVATSDGNTADDPAPSTPPPSTAGSPTPSAPDPRDSEVGTGGCWSATLGDMVDAGTCVESQYNGGGWFQCHDGEWFRGVSNGEGTFGQCTSTHSL